MYKKALLLLLSVFVVTIVSISCTTDQSSTDSAQVQSSTYLQLPLVYHMSFMSRYTKKLYFSGMAENWGLADIYAHEIEDISDYIMKAGYVHDGIDVGDLLEVLLVPQLALVEDAIKKKDKETFVSAFRSLIQTCNNCHVASNYSAVRVTIPEINPFNHDFTPLSR